jgi:hypothetical protein
VTALTGVREHRKMIRNVVIHASNEQPLLADLFDLPSADDAGLLCTNLRMMDGKRPVFIDQIESTFFFPYHVIRFLEIPEREMAAHRSSNPRRAPAARGTAADAPDDEATDEPSVDDAADEASLLPVAVGAPDPAAADEDLELEIDEGFLQRIRDI